MIVNSTIKKLEKVVDKQLLKVVNRQLMKRTKEIKEIIVGAKLPPSLVLLIDEDATNEGTSRSHIVRRTLLAHYRKKARRQRTGGSGVLVRRGARQERQPTEAIW